MELDALIDAICAKVQEKITAFENGECGACPCDEACDKAKLLVLAQDHGMICHPTYESADLAACYQVDCCLLMENGFDVADYEGIIAYTLTNDALGKIVNGVLDTPYTKAFGRALLLGKKIYIPEEEVELFTYKDTAPTPYYQCFEKQLKLLEGCGVTIVPNADLIPAILEGKQPEKAAAPCACVEKVVTLTKRVINERDMIAAREDQATKVCIGAKAIVTDLAKEYAKRYAIALVRE